MVKLQLISEIHDTKLSEDIAHWFMHGKTRQIEERLHKAEEAAMERQPRKMAAIRIMRENIEDPFPLSELAKRSHSSQRQLERLFKKHQNTTLKGYYLALRLDQAHRYITQSGMPLFDIVIAVGFMSQSHFSQCY